MPPQHPPRLLVRGSSDASPPLQDCLVLITDTPLSFWGGIDPVTAVVVDQSHPWNGQCVTDTILCLPSGRGSCTASQVLLELIARQIGPRAIVLRDADGLICVGAMVAGPILQMTSGIPDIVCVGQEGFTEILEQKETWRMDDRLLESAAASSTDDSVCSPTEEAHLAAATTEAERMALQVIFRYARVLQYQQQQEQSGDTTTTSTHHDDTDIPYVPITSAHIDGCTYIGPSGLTLAQRLVAAGGTVRVPTTLNAGSTDRQRWKQLGVPAPYAQNAIALGDAYVALGCQPSFTCAPYLLTNNNHLPTRGSHVAWGESNAVVYCNSVLGARTEKYADYLDICCAIAGIVPAVGVHVHRQPTIVLDARPMIQELTRETVDDDDDDSIDGDVVFPVLGHLCGTLSDSQIPLLIGLDEWKDMVTTDRLKAFCAAFGTTAASPLIHIAGITPEASDTDTVVAWQEACSSATKTITHDQLRATFEQLDQETAAEQIDLVALGNPHLSATECRTLAATVRRDFPNATAQPKTRIIACMSRIVHDEQVDPVDLNTLRSFGMEFVFDTCWCMLLDPPVIPPQQDSASTTILTHSGKYAHYGPGLVQRQFRLGSLRDCLHAARTGQYARRSTWWATTAMRTLRTWAR